jgi:hypothetical protein
MTSTARATALRLHTPLLIGVGVLAAVVMVVGPLVVRGYVLGLVQGGVAVALAAVALLPRLSGADTNLLDETVDVLRVARRQNLVWGWVDGVDGRLVVTRNGGVVAIAAQAHAVELTPEILANDAQQAQLAGRRASLALRSRDLPPAVRPLLVYWGAIQTDVAKLPVRSLEGVEFLPGPELAAWLRRQNGRPVERADARRIVKELRGALRRGQPGQGMGSRSVPLSPMVAD